MSSGFYESGVQALMKGDIDLENSAISAVLIDTSAYTVDLSNDSSQDDLPDSSQLSETALTGKTLDGTTFRADDVVFVSVASGSTASAVVLFLDTDYSDTSTLIAYIDNAVDFPITTDGTNVTVVWDTGANGIFKL